jgi:hypothetical protein
MFEIIRAGVVFYHDPGGPLLSYQDPLALKLTLMHFPFENWIQQTKVF